jgi:hypothetical protein
MNSLRQAALTCVPVTGTAEPPATRVAMASMMASSSSTTVP